MREADAAAAAGPADPRRRGLLATMAAAEHAFVLGGAGDDPLDPQRRVSVEATRGEMFGQPAAIRRTLERNDAALTALAGRMAGRFDRVLLTGAGDSLAVMVAARSALESALGVPCEPVQCLELAYYPAPLVGPRTAVVALSSSGETTRTVEAVLVAQERGAYTVCITNTPGSTLERESDASLLVSATRVGWPTQSSTAALALLYRLAVEIAGDRLGPALDGLPGAMGAALERLDGPVADIAAREAGSAMVLFSAGGPGAGAAGSTSSPPTERTASTVLPTRCCGCRPSPRPSRRCSTSCRPSSWVTTSGWPGSPPRRPAVGDRPRLLCVGNLTVDDAVAADGTRTTSAGGDALFAALAARLAGGHPQVLAPIGTDAPAELTAALRLVGAVGLPRRPLPCVRNEVVYAADGSRRWRLVTGEPHFEAMSVAPGDVGVDALAAADGILLSAMALGAQLRLAAWLRPRTAATIYFDPQEDYVAGHEVQLRDAVRACDVFLPSQVEAVALAGTADVAAAARSFLDLGPRVVVVKLAERGCLVARADRLVAVTAERAALVDSTGAGDAFCGAFAAVHLATGDAVTAARAAVAAARTAVEGHGVAGLVAALATVAPGGR